MNLCKIYFKCTAISECGFFPENCQFSMDKDGLKEDCIWCSGGNCVNEEARISACDVYILERARL